MSDPVGEVEPSLTLHQLIRERERMEERGLVLHRHGAAVMPGSQSRAVAAARFGCSAEEVPDPASLVVIARALELDLATVVLAAGLGLGLEVRPRRSGLGRLLPTGTERLSERTRAAILALIRRLSPMRSAIRARPVSAE